MEASSTTRSEKKKKPRQKSFFGKKASNTTRVSTVMKSRDKEFDLPPKADAIEIENHEIKDLFEEDSEADLQEEFEVKPYHKNVAVEYYDVMNPENYYPLVVNISNIEIQDRDTRENLLTGERKTQKKTEMDLSLKTPLVYVRPLFPGCDVTPNQILTDLNKTEDTLEFFITPIVKGEISGKIEFVQDDHVVYSFPLDAEVKDPRYARTIAAYGLLASVFPKLLAFLDIDLGNAREITNVIPFLGKYKFFSSMSLTSFIAIAGGLIALIVGVLYFLRQSPSSKKKSYTLSN